VRSGYRAVRLHPGLIHLILVLAALTSAQAFLVHFDPALSIVPVIVLVSAVAVLTCAPILARRSTSDRLRRIGRHRVEIAGGLILIGIALKTLLEHLA
jgi:putative Mn2+ efflux pump MntP